MIMTEIQLFTKNILKMEKSRSSVTFLDIKNFDNIDFTKVKLNGSIDFSKIIDLMIEYYKKNDLDDVVGAFEKHHAMLSEDICELVTYGLRNIFSETGVVFKNSHMLKKEMKEKGLIKK